MLGSILGGVATPTEAASVGAVGAILLAARKAGLRGLMMPVVEKTTQITAMIFLILIGATLFSLVFRALGGDDMVHRALSNLPGGVNGAVLAVMLAMFLLGFVMDAFEIIFVVVPIVAPALLTMPGVDPVWLGIMMAVNLQTSYMHPPLGPTLFYLRGVAPPEITTRHIYVGIIPFVLIQLFALVVLWFAPGLGDRAAACALWAVTVSPEPAKTARPATQSHTAPASSSDRKMAAEPMSLMRLMAGSSSRVMRSPSFSIAVLSNSTIRMKTSVPISAKRLPTSAVRKKASGIPIASSASSSRNACSDCAAATRPCQLLMVARQSRFTPSAPVDRLPGANYAGSFC